MKLLMFQVLFFALSSFVSSVTLDDEYEDDICIDTGTPNDTDTNTNETYSALAARLNCSQLLVSHKGIKIEETLSDSIYKPTQAPITVIIPFEDDYFTLLDITTEAYHNFTEYPPFPEYQDYTVQINFTDPSVLNDYIDFSPAESTEENSTVIAEPANSQDKDITIDQKNKTRAYPETNNGSKLEPDSKPPDCLFTFDDSGDKFNWFQIISQSGGIPGEVNASRLTPNTSEIIEPCHRPVNNTSPPLGDLLYEYESIEFNKFYRHEKAFLRFAGSPSEFVDIVGQLVWAPPKQDHRFYRLSYRKDDTGFYVYVRVGQKCVFTKDPISVDCYRVENLIPCVGITRSLSAGLQASLVG